MKKRSSLLLKLASFLEQNVSDYDVTVAMVWVGRSTWLHVAGANDVKNWSPKGQKVLHKGKCAVWP
jgi:hypothetical protein